MRIPLRLLACALVACAAAMTAQAVQVAPAPAVTETQPAAKCKAASFARRPPGQTATTMRQMQIDRCIKNTGLLD